MKYGEKDVFTKTSARVLFFWLNPLCVVTFLVSKLLQVCLGIDSNSEVLYIHASPSRRFSLIWLKLSGCPKPHKLPCANPNPTDCLVLTQVALCWPKPHRLPCADPIPTGCLVLTQTPQVALCWPKSPRLPCADPNPTGCLVLTQTSQVAWCWPKPPRLPCADPNPTGCLELTQLALCCPKPPRLP